jgi:aldose 1-epimerase
MVTMTQPIMGNQYDIEAGPYRATITEVGAGLRSLTRDGIPLILTYDADELAPAGSGELLVPWPNRVDRGRYSFAGEHLQLDITEVDKENAIHGLARWENWSAAEHEAHRVLMRLRLPGKPGYPFRLDLSAEFSLSERTGLTVTMTAVNAGSHPAPYGHGAHPYITLGRPLDECLLTIDAAERQPAGERAIPAGDPVDVGGTAFDFGEPRLIGATRIDAAFTGLRRDATGRAWIRLTDPDDGRSVAIWGDDKHPWLQAYTADGVPPASRRAGLGAEPMTCPPNAFVTGIDLVELKPGQQFSARWGIVG